MSDPLPSVERVLKIKIEFDREADGRWIGSCVEIPGVHGYGATMLEAERNTYELALRVIADRFKAFAQAGELEGFDIDAGASPDTMRERVESASARIAAAFKKSRT